MAASDFLEKELLDHVLGNAAYTAPSTVYLALFTTAQTDADGGTEVTGGSYARKDVTNNSTNFPAATGTSPTSKSLNVQTEFVTATADWGTVTHFGIYDAVSGGNLLFHGALSASQSVLNGNTARFNAGSLTITCD